MTFEEYTIKILKQYKKDGVIVAPDKADRLTTLEKWLIRRMWIFYKTLND